MHAGQPSGIGIPLRAQMAKVVRDLVSFFVAWIALRL